MYAQRAFKVSDLKLRNRSGKFLSFFAVLIAVSFFIELQPLAISFLIEFKSGKLAPLEYGILSGSLLTLFADKLLPHLRKVSGRFMVYLIGILGFAFFWLLYLNLCVLAMSGQFALDAGIRGFVLHPYFLGALALFAYASLTVDVNFTGIHKFYRDRLSKAYIVGFRPERERESGDADAEEAESYEPDEVIPTDHIKLSALDSDYAPYHLINTLLNLEKTREAHQTGRHGDFFIFSKRFIGGEITGYSKTEDMESVSRNVDLATAMAISGAAAAPNMGRLTIKPLVFLLAMLNIRLNYWLPNPAKLKKPMFERLANKMSEGSGLQKACMSVSKNVPRAPWSRVGAIYLLRELIGRLDVKHSHVNLSDGGHIENLGIYELLRRECRMIIAGDGEADPNLCFAGLAEVTRMALIDFGIKIDIDGLDEIRRGEQHHAIGNIYYRNGRVGKLIYLKLSMLGDNNLRSSLEPELYRSSPYRDDNDLFDDNAYIANYKKQNPDFPHQSTADQFFDEAQFECYRALGYEVAMRTLGAR